MLLAITNTGHRDPPPQDPAGQAAFTGPPLTAIVVVVAAVNTALAPIVVRAVRWARLDEADARHPFFLR